MQRQNEQVLTSPNNFAVIADVDIQQRPSFKLHMFRLPQSMID
jgi:hypothetical protein